MPSAAAMVIAEAFAIAADRQAALRAEIEADLGNPNVDVRLIRIDDEPVAVGRRHDGDGLGYLSAIGVRRAWQGLGLGEAITRALAESAAGAGLEHGLPRCLRGECGGAGGLRAGRVRGARRSGHGAAQAVTADPAALGRRSPRRPVSLAPASMARVVVGSSSVGWRSRSWRSAGRPSSSIERLRARRSGRRSAPLRP